MQPQDPCYFVLVNRTPYDLRYIDKNGSDWPGSTQALNTNWVLKPGKESGIDIGILLASSWGTSQWGHIYFAVEGYGRHETLLVYLHSNNPENTYWKASILDNSGDRPSGRNNVPGRPVGGQSGSKGDLTWIVFSGGDIMAPLGLDWWMRDLCNINPDARNWPLARFKIPGTHDSCTWGTGTFDFSWRCQDMDLYGQAVKGIREFDIRLKARKVDDYWKFIPHHGAAEQTAPDFADTPWQLGANTIAERIMSYADQHPTEVFILRISTDGVKGNLEAEEAFGQTINNHLGRRLASYPSDNHTPTYQEIMDQNNRNLILYSDFWGMTGPGGAPSVVKDNRRDWNVEGLRQPGDGGHSYLYNEDIWKSGEPGRIIDSVKSYIWYNSDAITNHRKIWGAQVQLTPSLDVPFGEGAFTRIGQFFNDPSVSPRSLAAIAIPQLKWRVPDCGELQKGGNCITYDFAEDWMSSAIVSMNLLPLY